MTYDYHPDLDPAAVPLEGEKPPPTRHQVKAHDRTLPPKPHPPDDPDQPRLFEMDRQDPPPRIIQVRPHVRRNPRHSKKETPMSMTPPLAHSDPIDLARLTDPQTSHDAAESVLASGSISRSQAWVLEQFRSRGPAQLIDHDLETIALTTNVRLTPQRIRTARHDLLKAGFLAKSGTKRKTPYGRDAEVHVLTEKGRTAVFTPYHDDRTDAR